MFFSDMFYGDDELNLTPAEQAMIAEAERREEAQRRGEAQRRAPQARQHPRRVQPEAPRVPNHSWDGVFLVCVVTALCIFAIFTLKSRLSGYGEQTSPVAAAQAQALSAEAQSTPRSQRASISTQVSTPIPAQPPAIPAQVAEMQNTVTPPGVPALGDVVPVGWEWGYAQVEVNLFQAPADDAPIIFTVPAHTRVLVHGIADAPPWSAVILDNGQAWGYARRKPSGRQTLWPPDWQRAVLRGNAPVQLAWSNHLLQPNTEFMSRQVGQTNWSFVITLDGQTWGLAQFMNGSAPYPERPDAVTAALVTPRQPGRRAREDEEADRDRITLELFKSMVRDMQQDSAALLQQVRESRQAIEDRSRTPANDPVPRERRYAFPPVNRAGLAASTSPVSQVRNIQ